MSITGALRPRLRASLTIPRVDAMVTLFFSAICPTSISWLFFAAKHAPYSIGGLDGRAIGNGIGKGGAELNDV